MCIYVFRCDCTYLKLLKKLNEAERLDLTLK